MTADRSRGAVSVGALALALAVLLVATSPAQALVDRQAGGPPPPPLQVASVSPWVAPDGTFEVSFLPTTTAPLDATLSYTIHQRLRPGRGTTLRERTDAVLDGAEPGGILQATVRAPMITYGNPVEGLQLRIPISGTTNGGGRVLVPTAGIHPVVLELRATDGRSLWSETVFLNRLPDRPVEDPSGEPGRLSVTLVVPVEGPPSLTPDGRPQLDAPTRADVAAATGLLSQVPEAPVVLALRPNTLTGVIRSDTGPDAAFVQALRSPTVRATVARRTDVAVDVAGLVAASAADAVIQQLDLGDRVVRAATGRTPATDTWLLDDTIDADALPLLEGVGTRRVVLPVARLRLPGGTPPETARTRALALQGAPGLTAVADDPELTLRIADPRIEPGLRANQVATVLMATWFTAAAEGPDAFPGPTSVIVMPAATDPDVVRALLPALAGTGPLTADPAAVPARPGRVGGEVVTAALAPRPPTDQRRAVRLHRSTRAVIDSFAGMADGAEPELSTWEQLNSEVLSTQTDSARKELLAAGVAAEVRARVGAIRLPAERRVVLTSRDATIPLRFRNDLPYPVRVRATYRSPRLEVDGGSEQTVVLQPGENRVDLAVAVRAPGSALLRIDVRSPDGRLEVGAAALPVTSSRISGVGAVLSIVFLLVLAGWWVLTVRRSRTSRHQPSRDGPRPPDTPTDTAADPPGPSGVPVGPSASSHPGPGGSVGDGG